MRWTTALAVSVLGCSDDGPAADPYKCVSAGGDACFQMPTDVVYATDAGGAIVEPMLDCEPYEPSFSAGTLSGLTVDAFDSEQTIGGVELLGFRDLELTDGMFDVISAEDGSWAASVVELPRRSFAVSRRPGALDVHVLYREVDTAQSPASLRFPTATREQLSSLLATAGDQFLPGTTQVLAFATDCAGQPLGNVIANSAPVSARAGSRLFDPGVRIYYRVEGTAPVLARRTMQWQTASAGSLSIANLSPGTHYIQLWGFRTPNDVLYEADGIELLAEYPIETFEGEAAVVMSVSTRD